jgi:hypothetical protein
VQPPETQTCKGEGEMHHPPDVHPDAID